MQALAAPLFYFASMTTVYNAANQLLTAKLNSSSDVWYYQYDGNGNQVRQVPNGLTPVNGETRYTFNQRNLLIQAETHNGSGYQVQAEVTYDGNGGRLQAVAYVGGIPITTTFILDNQNNNLPLVTDNGTEATILLYGLFGLGQYQGEEWHYYLGDGQRTVRQLVNDAGEVTLVRTYDPFGGLLAIEGVGTSLFGFAGALEGAGSLLYVNGRYYDPATGRFLSPNHDFDPRHPSRGLNGYLANYLMANPLAVLLPLAVFLNRRKRKGQGLHKTDVFLLGLFLIVGISACQNQGPQQPENAIAPTSTEIAQGSPQPSATSAPLPTQLPPTNTTTPTTTPIPTATPTPQIVLPDCPTPTPAPTDTPTPGLPTNVGNDLGPRQVGAISLSTDQLDVLALLVFGESSNGTVPLRISEMKTWVLLNKLTNDAASSNVIAVYNSWRGSEAELIVTYFTGPGETAKANRLAFNFGPEPAVGPQEEFDLLLRFAQRYKELGQTTSNSRAYNAIRDSVDEVYNLWYTQGTNSTADPTHGSLFFNDPNPNIDKSNRAAIEAEHQRIVSLYAHLRTEYAKRGVTFSYVITEVEEITPGRFSFTVFRGCYPSPCPQLP
jgi:RHS repeat-associated protein